MSKKKDLEGNQEAKIKKLNSENTSLKNFLMLEKNVIPSSLCDEVIDEIKTHEWKKHLWSDFEKEYHSEQNKELSILFSTDSLHDKLSSYIVESGYQYLERYSFPSEKTRNFIHKCSRIRFNRYSPGEMMRLHHDHIRTLFDSNESGIPILSFIMNLNDDYEGSDLYFWDNYKIELSKGDILVFPSNFLFPHRVTETNTGIRYSAVSWAW